MKARRLWSNSLLERWLVVERFVLVEVRFVLFVEVVFCFAHVPSNVLAVVMATAHGEAMGSKVLRRFRFALPLRFFLLQLLADHALSFLHAFRAFSLLCLADDLACVSKLLSAEDHNSR